MSAPAWGIVAVFETPAEILRAAEAVRDAGYRRFDVHTPFPVHHMDRAMGLRDTRLPWVILGMAVLGCATAVGLQGWAMGKGYPFILSGKPLFSLPAFVPIIFELTVLFAAFGAVFGMLAFNRLPALYHPLFKNRPFSRVARDGFFIVIESSDEKFKAEDVRKLFESLGAKEIEDVHD